MQTAFSQSFFRSALLLGLISFVSQANLFASSSEHHRSFDGFAALSEYFRWQPGRDVLISAHRGGPEDGFPENAIETFENTLTYAPCMLEVDVRRSSDGALYLMHDSTLDRTSTGQGPVGEIALAELRQLQLIDNQGTLTPFAVPTLHETLDWARDRAVLFLDVKDVTDFEAVIDTVNETQSHGQVAVIVYSLDAMQRVYELDPELMMSVSCDSFEDLAALKASGVPLENMVAYVGGESSDQNLINALHAEGMMTILGAMGAVDARAKEQGPEAYQSLIDLGGDIIATDFVPLAAQAVLGSAKSF